MPPFDLAKFRQFFAYYDEKSPQHKEAVKRLFEAVHALDPKIMSDEAYWVEAYRKRPKPAPLPVVPPESSGKVSIQGRIQIQPQHMPRSCGQTCVAMAINYLKPRKPLIDDYWVDRNYGYDLLGALNQNCGGKKWADVGNFKPSMWDAIYHNLSKGLPGAIIGLNGPEFSPSGYGHILMIVSIDGNNVGLADPNGGEWRTETKHTIETCPDHTEGKFVFMVTG